MVQISATFTYIYKKKHTIKIIHLTKNNYFLFVKLIFLIKINIYFLSDTPELRQSGSSGGEREEVLLSSL